MRQSLLQISTDDGAFLVKQLNEQNRVRKNYELDAADLRQVTNRTVIRTESGEVEVEVPERELETPSEHPAEVRELLKMQAKVAQLGATLGFTIWLPPADRAKVVELERIPVTFEHSPRAERSSCILVG